MMKKATEATRGWTRPDDAAESAIEPIRRIEDVGAIRRLLDGRPRDLLLFSLGVNNALRAGDLLRVTVNQLRAAAPGRSVRVREKHTGAETSLFVPVGAAQALCDHLRTLDPPSAPGDMYLFAGQRGWTPLTAQRLDEMVSEWARAVGLPGRYGAHTLRKTFGYLQRVRFGVDLEILAKRFGHPSAAVTRRYLGLNGDDGEEVCLAEI